MDKIKSLLKYSSFNDAEKEIEINKNIDLKKLFYIFCETADSRNCKALKFLYTKYLKDNFTTKNKITALRASIRCHNNFSFEYIINNFEIDEQLKKILNRKNNYILRHLDLGSALGSNVSIFKFIPKFFDEDKIHNIYERIFNKSKFKYLKQGPERVGIKNYYDKLLDFLDLNAIINNYSGYCLIMRLGELNIINQFFTDISYLFTVIEHKQVINLFEYLRYNNIIDRISLVDIIDDDKVKYDKKELLLELKEKDLLNRVNVRDLVEDEDLLENFEYLVEKECEKCPICYDNCCNIQTPCHANGHKFCSRCINTLLNRDTYLQCPICRKEIDKIYFNFNNKLDFVDNIIHDD